MQAKLSLDINNGNKNETKRFTIVGLWGRYILKPQTDRFTHLPEDTEELALTLNDKKRKIKKTDFIASMQASGLEDKIIENIFNKFVKVKDKLFEFIDMSFLPNDMKETFKTIIAVKLNLLS